MISIYIQRTLAAIRAEVETIVPRLPARSTDARPLDPVALRKAMQRLRLGNHDIVPRVETSIALVVPSSDGPAVDPLPLSPSHTGPLVMDDSFPVSADGIVISPRDIVHLVRDDVHDDSTIHAFETPAFSIVGETIEVLGALRRPVSDLVAPVPVPVPTPPRTRRGPRGSCSRSARNDESLVIHLPSTMIPRGIRLTGRAAAVYRHFDPSNLDLPLMIPVGVEVSIWGSRWIVRSSTLGPRAGLGLFACEDIIVDAADMDSSAHLFPYAGTVYLRDDMRVLHACSPGGFTPYLLDVDSTRPSIPPTERRFIDGDPARCSNIAGYINSSLGRRQGVSDGQISENVPDIEMLPRRLQANIRAAQTISQHVSGSRKDDDYSSSDEEHPWLENEADGMDELFMDFFPPKAPVADVEGDDHEAPAIVPRVDDGSQTRRNTTADRQWEAAQEESRTPIYPGAKCSKLAYTLLILNLQARFPASNQLINGIFKLLAEKILPEESNVPKTRSEARKILKTVGMDYEMIHVCPNDCILYRNEYGDATACPKCNEARYREDTQGTKIAKKVLRRFPIIPRLRHMFRCRSIANLMTWHSSNRSTDGTMRFVSNSPAVAYIEETWPKFARDPRHLRLGLASDGVSPYSIRSLTYSVWPVALMNYNIPPWLATKKGFILLALIVPGTQELREAIYDLSRLMRWVCSKEINVSEVPRMDIFAAETLCKLEKTLPPSFFDSQIHLLVHLVREISICGPVHTRWMYWLERYMKVLKDDVRQRAKPEGSMAKGHLHREAMFFCSTILAQLDP
ncbi:hypothetical protein R1sor_016921 [Riccia sorocarpa]|uniref:DUF4218 domain-containing protein n=1 Tax=Riccia sorocarpa TaxID=122646 RepID=A0ABD3HJQ4_9MARC